MAEVRRKRLAIIVGIAFAIAIFGFLFFMKKHTTAGENTEGIVEDTESTAETAESVTEMADEGQTQSTAPEDSGNDPRILGEIPDLEECEELSTALDMLVVYGVEYEESMQDPDEEFWEGFKAALLCNSWFAPFYDEDDTEVIWDNERIAAAGSLLTGRELSCTCFPEGIDIRECASPWLSACEKVNVHIERLEQDKFEISYDMMWGPNSMTSIDGMIRVSTTIGVNNDSPLNGYSILELMHEEVSGYVLSPAMGGYFDYDVSADNEEIHERLYELTDGIHTTMDGSNLSDILDVDNKDYVFADVNGDSKDDMIIRTYGYWPNFFFYTDRGILWSASPIGSSSEIWFTEDYLLVGCDSHSSGDVYEVYKSGRDGNFEQAMLLRNYHGENGERFVFVAANGEEKEITEEEYKYLTEYLESLRAEIEWVTIP